MLLVLNGPKRVDSVSWSFLGLLTQILQQSLHSEVILTSKILPKVLFECYKNHCQTAYTVSEYHILLIFLFSWSMKHCGIFCRLTRKVLKLKDNTHYKQHFQSAEKPCPCYFPCQVHELQKPVFCLLSRGKGSDNCSILQLITVSEAKSVRKKIQRKKISLIVYFIEEK